MRMPTRKQVTRGCVTSKSGIADAVPVADANLVIRKSIDGEVFSELAEGEILATEELLPVVVGVHLIHKYGSLFTAVAGEVTLRIAINVKGAHHPAIAPPATSKPKSGQSCRSTGLRVESRRSLRADAPSAPLSCRNATGSGK